MDRSARFQKSKLIVPPRGDAILAQIANFTGPVIGAEIGVHKGILSNYLLTKRPDLTLYMVDCWKQFDSDTYRATKDACAFFSQGMQDQFMLQAVNNTREHREAGRAIVVRKDSEEASLHFADNSLDFVFIDAEHSYEACKRDIQTWCPKVRPGGIVSGHDYKNTDYPSFSVEKAVHEVLGDVIELGTDFTWFWHVPLTSQE
jgi:Methyltransferase domain